MTKPPPIGPGRRLRALLGPTLLLLLVGGLLFLALVFLFAVLELTGVGMG